MRIHLVSIGQRMPAWVDAGFDDYARRLPPECALTLKALPGGLAGKGRARTGSVSDGELPRLRRDEGERILAAVPARARVIALDLRGRAWSSEQLASELAGWLADGRDIALLVGGPNGLSDACLARAEQRWSLSPLTLPHPLVRVLVAEQLYRAWSQLQGHPYHRG
ncbi:MAG: 23S rRNA (pseudouridine(1915)-N(3))-methyltransferase RlmH [Thiohalocapsa sp.]|jgi:23S rRNA (pseudouridine1915-N3)-methyltransferase